MSGRKPQDQSLDRLGVRQGTAHATAHIPAHNGQPAAVGNPIGLVNAAKQRPHNAIGKRRAYPPRPAPPDSLAGGPEWPHKHCLRPSASFGLRIARVIIPRYGAFGVSPVPVSRSAPRGMAGKSAPQTCIRKAAVLKKVDNSCPEAGAPQHRLPQIPFMRPVTRKHLFKSLVIGRDLSAL